MDSHACPEYHAVRYCARIEQVSSKKKKHEILLFWSSGAGSVTQWIASETKACNLSADFKKAMCTRNWV